MAADKLLAEWFWIDRWNGSNGFLLPMESRGIYREMLTQAWRRGGRLPNDHEAIRRAIGATTGEWRRSWPKVRKFWRIEGDNLVNDTQLEVYADAQARAERASSRGLRGAQARHKHSTSSAQVDAQAQLEHQPPSPSPVIQEPPNPLSAKGGRLRILRKDRTEAARLLALNFGRCNHQPQHLDKADCVADIAAALAERRRDAEQRATA